MCHYNIFFACLLLLPMQIFGVELLNFEIKLQWQYINFTWPSHEIYQQAVTQQKYIPQNVAMVGKLKYYKDKIFGTLPQLRPGVPATLGFSELHGSSFNQLITPYPSWEMNIQPCCDTLQSVLSVEIDKSGIMWIIDGVRINNLTHCPTKIVLLNLENNGEVVFSHTFPEELSLSQGGFLNDIVLDYTSDGILAYITDASFIDPGIIVFNKTERKAWKLRDGSMFPEISRANFQVGKTLFTPLACVNGIALSPPDRETKLKTLYYSSLTGVGIHSITNNYLKNFTSYQTGDWRRAVRFVGNKQSQGDGMIMDNKGNLYYGVLPQYGVGEWNNHKNFSTSRIVADDRQTMVWVDTFDFDEKGNLFMMADEGGTFMDTSIQLHLDGRVKIRIFEAYTGTKSYLYSK